MYFVVYAINSNIMSLFADSSFLFLTMFNFYRFQCIQSI